MAMHGFNPNNTSNSNYSNYSAIQIMYVGTRIICVELSLLWANNASSNLQILTARDVLRQIMNYDVCVRFKLASKSGLPNTEGAF